MFAMTGIFEKFMIEDGTEEIYGIGLTFIQSKGKADAFNGRWCEEWRRIANERIEGDTSIQSNYVTFLFFSSVN